MKKTSLLIGICAGLASNLGMAATAPPDDPFIWLEQAHSARAMNWVRAENAKTDAVLERDPRFKTLYHDAKVIVEAKDRIPEPSIIGGKVFNFWQDAEHPHGIWRETSQADFQNTAPDWRTVVDLDALSKSEKANWFWKGAICREPEEQRCMLNLSDGGEDAVSLREFDLAKGAFVDGGFALPTGKQDVAWQDADTLLISREWKPGEVTRSGYAYVVKRIKRGQPLDAAVEVFRGTAQDVSAAPIALNDGSGHSLTLVQRAVSIFDFEFYLLGAQQPVKLAMPMKTELLGLIDGRLVASLHEDWKRAGQPTLQQGSLVSFELSAVVSDPRHLQPALIYAPTAREAFVEAGITRGHLLVHTLDNVNGRAFSYAPEPNDRWVRRQLELPDNISVNIIDADLHGDQAFVQVAGFLTPPRLMLADLGKGTLLTVKTLPAKFDASHHVVEQFAATSKDGTKIPYFIVHPTAMKMDGSTPTILNAYGGFMVARTPMYSAELGKLWLERGGAFVLANIRGGGEFGPAWHEAGLKTHRQRIYDDFAAVGEDIIAKKLTSSPHLGIMGGSNGGLLMGVEFIQHPQLWGAVDIQVPLLDMLRYEQIAAGSSWVGEYGSVSVPAQRAFLASISPYNNLKPGVNYPQALIWSTTKDDRVGPQHARKFAAKLASMGAPYLYFEVIEGGHGAGATPEERAKMQAREYSYFSGKLGL
ncbi:MAG TPA: prolyl oligopeptidase family serine peptidase [Steroidobacteraceae bacterium]|jgi:prolyl oligopeptidase|nr:prolyl oligopeptidase family serine peptidase [Steroidobacteraceae bacterium]